MPFAQKSGARVCAEGIPVRREVVRGVSIEVVREDVSRDDFESKSEGICNDGWRCGNAARVVVVVLLLAADLNTLFMSTVLVGWRCGNTARVVVVVLSLAADLKTFFMSTVLVVVVFATLPVLVLVSVLNSVRCVAKFGRRGAMGRGHGGGGEGVEAGGALLAIANTDLGRFKSPPLSDTLQGMWYDAGL